MHEYLLDWLNLLLRWAHVAAAVAWVGASFHFIWLEYSAGRSDDPRLPGFKWEAYWTWLTGFLLLAQMYYAGAEVYLIDRSVLDITPWQAIAIGLCSIAIAWMAYDLLCKSFLRRSDAAFAAAMLILLVATAWGLCRVFGGRGAFIHFGAILGTIMAANVAHVVIPGYRELLRAHDEAREPARQFALASRQRSLHNTYLALPALIVMLSGHYPMLWAGPWNWLVLVALSLAGILIRAWFVTRHRSRPRAWPLAAALLLLGAAAALALRPPT